jgi:chromosome segregation protein
MKYLEGQSRDLARALANLEKVAKDTEGKIKAIFEKGFKSINENFAKNFKDLFGGGEAELKLSRGDDDYGVEIIVKLPNKNAQNIASLSGGEKALASVALLSGILVSNPSPFVVLDEVDAALDEENTKRFASIISKITDHSQVLVVTHNHETMAVADELLGVTTSGNNESSIIRVELGSFPLEAAK